MIAPETRSQDVSHNLEVLSYFNTAPKLPGSSQIRLIVDKYFPTQIVACRVSEDARAIDTQKYRAGLLTEEKYGIRGVARTLTEMIPRLNEVRDIHLLQSAHEGLTKLTGALKGDNKKALLKPLSDALVAHIDAQPKHRTAVRRKSALKIDVTDPSLPKSTRRISFGTNTVIQVTPHGNCKPLPSLVSTSSPKKGVAVIRTAVPTRAPELPAIPLAEKRCAEILQRGKGVLISSRQMRDIREDLFVARVSYVFRHREDSERPPEYKQVVEAYDLRIAQLLDATSLAQRASVAAPKSQIVYTGKGPTCYYSGE